MWRCSYKHYIYERKTAKLYGLEVLQGVSDLLVKADWRQGWKIRGYSDRKWAVLRVCSRRYTLRSSLDYFGWILICIRRKCYSANLIPTLGQNF